MVAVLMPPRPMTVAPPPRPSRARIVVVVVLAVLVLMVAGVVAVRAVLSSAEVTREPVATTGANPFMPSVGVDQANVRTVAHATGRYSGSTPGLYGGSGDDRVCDRSQLARYLDTHADKATGWAAVLGVRAGDIDSYVASLTPVVLRSDTVVTNHGWQDGEVTSYPAVLQAGTAVLVDPYGTPVVRCFCGNPLSAPAAFHTVSYVGPSWVSFSSTDVTVITSTTTVTNDYTLVDVHSGAGVDRPRGTDGDHDRDTGRPGGGLGVGSGGPQTGATGADPGRSRGPTTTPGTTDRDPETVLADGAWRAGPGCPSSLSGGALSFSGGSYTVAGGPGGSYSLSGRRLTLTPTATSSSSASTPTARTSSVTPTPTSTSTSSSGPSGSAASSSPTTSPSSTPPSSSAAPSSAAAPRPITLTLSTASTPATASGASCTLAHTS